MSTVELLIWGMATGAIGRIFLTGVSPITLDDITSGANFRIDQ